MLKRSLIILILGILCLIPASPRNGFGQCSPTPGLFYTTTNFLANTTFNAAPYTLNKTSSAITVKQSGSTIYTHNTPTGYISKYFFYGTNNAYLMIQDYRTTSTSVYFRLKLVNLSNSPSPAEYPLLNRTFFTSQSPQLDVQPSAGNGQAVFFYIGRDPGPLSQVQDLEIHCSDTGALMCSTTAFHPTGQVIAEATSSTVRIKEGGTIKAECPLPAPAFSISTSSLNFGSVVVGSTVTRQFTITNSGTAPLTYSISSNNPMFTTSPSSGTLNASGNQVITVTFSPPLATAAGSQTGTLSITHNATNTASPASVSLTASVVAAQPHVNISTSSLTFGSVVAGSTVTKQFTITNSGTAPLTYSISSNNSMFTASPSSNTINTSGNQTITVTFSPPLATATGSQTGTLSITHNATNTASPASVSLTASVVAAQPQIQLVPTNLAFGNVVAGLSGSRQLTISNVGTAPLTYSISSNNSMFTASPSGGTLNASGNQVITVTFSPPLATAAGGQTGTLSITHNATNTASPATVTYSANVVLPTKIIAVSPSTVYFGKVGINYNLTKIITITNNGNSPLTINNITSTNSKFTINQTFPFTIAQGSNQKQIEITFSPTNTGVQTGQLNFSSNATNTPPTVLLTGEGISPPTVDAHIVLDKSGSMSEGAGSSMTKMDRLKSAANLFIDLARAGQGDNLGVVKFNYPASDYVSNLTAINSTTKSTLKNGVTALNPGGATSIGKGLELALSEMTNPGISTNSHKVILLLSDGKENSAPFVDSNNGTPVITIPTTPDIDIYTVGLGLAENMNTNLLSDMAFNSVGSTKGYFHLTQDNWYTLHKFFISIFGDTFNEYVVVDPEYKLGSGETVTIPVNIVDSDKSATFAAYWTNPETKIYAELIAPNGTTITPKTADSLGTIFVQGDIYAFYSVPFDPSSRWRDKRSGKWIMKVRGVAIPGGVNKETLSVSVIAPSDLSFKPYVNQGIYSTGDVILLSAELLERGQPGQVKKVVVSVTKPNEGLGNTLSTNKISDKDYDVQLGLNPDSISSAKSRKIALLQKKLSKPLITYSDSTFFLYDDGMHGDTMPGDGIWANFYRDTQVEGVYTFRVVADVTSRLNESTTREKTLSATVAVNRVDRSKTEITVSQVAVDVANVKGYKVSVVPKDSFGNFMGPGYANSISFSSSNADFKGPVIDNNAGEYSQALHVPSGTKMDDVNIEVTIMGNKESWNLGGKVKPQEDTIKKNIKLWLIILIILIVIFLIIKKLFSYRRL